MCRVEIRDGSDNLILGVSTVERAREFLAWLDRQDDEIRRDRRVVAFEMDANNGVPERPQGAELVGWI